jgi:signal transduction histidine kinase
MSRGAFIDPLRFRQKSELLSSISHELRTPLNAIINLPEHVLDQIASVRTASCAECSERFMLDAEEQLTTNTPCPLCQKPALREATQKVFERDESPAPKSLVLYVEDDAVNQQIARTRLSKKDEVLLAANDHDACNLVIEHHTNIVVILLDIEL